MDYQQLIVDKNVSILHTLEQMDKCNRKLLLVSSAVIILSRKIFLIGVSKDLLPIIARWISPILTKPKYSPSENTNKSFLFIYPFAPMYAIWKHLYPQSTVGNPFL